MVITHGPERAITLDKEGVEVACTDVSDRTGHNLHGRIAAGGTAITELAMIIMAHRPKGAITLDKEGVEVARSDGGDP